MLNQRCSTNMICYFGIHKSLSFIRELIVAVALSGVTSDMKKVPDFIPGLPGFNPTLPGGGWGGGAWLLKKEDRPAAKAADPELVRTENGFIKGTCLSCNLVINEMMQRKSCDLIMLQRTP